MAKSAPSVWKSSKTQNSSPAATPIYALGVQSTFSKMGVSVLCAGGKLCPSKSCDDAEVVLFNNCGVTVISGHEILTYERERKGGGDIETERERGFLCVSVRVCALLWHMPFNGGFSIVNSVFRIGG